MPRNQSLTSPLVPNRSSLLWRTTGNRKGLLLPGQDTGSVQPRLLAITDLQVKSALE